MRRAPTAPPPPAVSRPPSLLPSRLPLTADLRPPCLVSRRGERGPRPQDGRRVQVDGGGRVCGSARPRVGRARAQRRRPLEARSAVADCQSATADRYLCTPTSFFLLSVSTTPSARAADASPTGARAPRASVAPLAASARPSVDAYFWLWAVSSSAVVLSVHACMYFSGLFSHGSSAYDVQTFDYNTHCSLIPASGRPTHVI